MRLLHRLASIVRWLVHRHSAEQDLHDEVQAYVEMAAADRRRDGASSADARRMAVLDPATIGGAVILMAIASQIAAYVPARQASRADPLVALGHD